jgi:hypothetical protein
LIIGSKADWEQWTFNGKPLKELQSQKVFTLTPQGVLQAGRVEKREVNVAPRGSLYQYKRGGIDFHGGVRSAGSNAAQAGRIIDGRMATYWAPDATTDISDWWVEVDLGYAVSAKKIRLRFASDKTPLPGFQVFVSEGARRFRTTSSLALDYELVAATRRPNQEPVYEVVFDTRERYLASGGELVNDPGVPEVVFAPVKDSQGNLTLGRVVQFVKIVFTEKVADPGLAELEVYAIGENLIEGTIERGGSYEAAFGIPAVRDMFDGLMWTEWWVSQNASWEEQGWFKIDLGNAFWLDTIRLLSLPRSRAEKPGTDIDGFKVYVSDGTEAAFSTGAVWQVGGKDMVWEQVAEVHNNQIPKLVSFDLEFPPRPARYIFFHHDFGAGFFRSLISPGVIYEIHLFGEGVVPGLTFRSNLIDLGQSMNLTSISWEPVPPPGVRLEFRTRTGRAVASVQHYYTTAGKEVSAAAYAKLLPFLQGDIVEDVAPVDSVWSSWSEAYAQPGEMFKSPSPRQYVALEARMLAEEPQAVPTLQRVKLSFTRPAVSGLVGRIDPRESYPGRPTRFTFTLEPNFQRGDAGFDEVLLLTPGRVDSVVLSIRGIEQSALLVRVFDDSLKVRLPRTVQRDSVQIAFRVPVYNNGTTFSALVSNASVAGLQQRVDPDPRVKNATTVYLPALAQTKRLVGDLTVRPAGFTPNGDRVNDRVEIGFSVRKVDGFRPVAVAMYDLSGELVHTLLDGSVSSGPVAVSWDGRDREGRLVPPGIYVCRVRVAGQDGDGAAMALVGVVH